MSMQKNLQQCFQRASIVFVLLSFTCAQQLSIESRDASHRVDKVDEVVETDEAHYLADRLWVDLKLQRFYDSISQLRFCFDFDSPHEVLQLLRDSLPAEELMESNSPVPDGDALPQDDICGNWDEMVDYMCHDEEDFILYFQFILQTDDPEKIPDTKKCSSSNTGFSKRGCLPGFFQTENGPHPCCAGFFCPQMLNCMIPCPLGANCPKAHAYEVPQDMLRGLDESVHENVCSPYGYQERSDLGCGGADKWDTSPTSAFFPVNDTRGHIYCPSGHYCEDTVNDPELCHRSYFCRVGSVKPSHCPFMTICPDGTSLPEDYFGLAFDGFMFVLLALTWQASRYYNRILRRLSARERVRIHWGVHPRWDIVAPTPAGFGERSALPASAFARGHPSLRNRSSMLPRLVALQTFSNTLSRTLSRSSENRENRRPPAQPPAVWASLSQELSPDHTPQHTERAPQSRVGHDDAEDDRNSPVSQEHLIEDLNFDAVTIDFYALTLKVRSCGKLVVCGASGKFESSKLTVVMGPSGCGKTSLLSYLACQGDYTMTSGMILVNGTQSTLKRYRKVTGFVPQDDIIHPKLTVEENLLFSARYRLTKRMKRHEILAVVDRAIHLLGLVDVRNQLVGNEESRGISGGQRKRVNIGLELVADPWVLFLDEPTSGLDSTSCRHVLSALAKIAHMGVTCAAVVHQPSNRVMKMFDDVLLMGRNGRTIYFGPQSALKSYFRALGFEFPEDENPADVYLDIITRPKAPPIAPHKSLTDVWETHDFRFRYLSHPQLDAELYAETSGHTNPTPVDTVLEETGCIDRLKSTLWMSLYLLVSPFCIAVDAAYKGVQSLSGTRRHFGGYSSLLSDGGEDEDVRITPGVVTQFWLCFYRCMLERTRSALRIFVEYALYAVSGMILGILSDARSSGRMNPFISDMNYNIVAIALMTTVGSLRTFSQNQLIFLRESKAGLNKLAFYCATALFGDVGSILKGLCYLSLYHSYAQHRALFNEMFLVTASLIYSCSGFGYLISKVLKPGPAQLTAAVFVLSNALLTRGRTSALISFIRTFLYHRWALEAYIISEAKQLFGVWSLERCATLHVMQYDIRHFPFTIVALISLGIVTRTLSFAVMMFGMRDRSY